MQFLGSFIKKVTSILKNIPNDLEILRVYEACLNVNNSTQLPRLPTPKTLFVCIPAEKVTNTFLELLLASMAKFYFCVGLTLL